MDRIWPTSALRAVERSFAALACDFEPLELNGVPLARLRDQLLRPHASLTDKDSAWRHLIELARSGDPRWVVATVGMALPGLKRHGTALRRVLGADGDDIDADLVQGFLEALARVDVDRPGIAARLIWAARRAAARNLPKPVERLVEDLERRPDLRPQGHPDFVLVDAVALGVISDLDARMLAATRLEKAPDDLVAAAMGIRVGTLRVRRHRAARKLAAALTSGAL